MPMRMAGCRRRHLRTPRASLRTYPGRHVPVKRIRRRWTNKLLLDGGFTFHPEAHSNAPQRYTSSSAPRASPRPQAQQRAYTYRASPTSFIAHTWQYRRQVLHELRDRAATPFKFGLQDMWGKRIIQNWAMNPFSIHACERSSELALTLTSFPYEFRIGSHSTT